MKKRYKFEKQSSASWRKIRAKPHRPGSAGYYRDALWNIYALCFDYDGHNPGNARRMRELVDEAGNMALAAFQNQKLYIKPDIGGKRRPGRCGGRSGSLKPSSRIQQTKAR